MRPRMSKSFCAAHAQGTKRRQKTLRDGDFEKWPSKGLHRHDCRTIDLRAPCSMLGTAYRNCAKKHTIGIAASTLRDEGILAMQPIVIGRQRDDGSKELRVPHASKSRRNVL